jgi:surface antigen
VVPVDNGAKGGFNIFSPFTNLSKSTSNNTGLVLQQAATATAVTQDGFDQGGGQTFAGLPTIPPDAGAGGLGRFFYGQCTWWANYRYHQMSNIWVPWLGNAWQWRYGAANYGWVVSATPKVGAIVVLQPGVQGAGYYGHVAIVEQVNPDGSVNTSNFNWLGNWGRETSVTFHPGYGISFVWHP